MRGIEISSQRAKLDIVSTRAKLNIKSPKPRMYIRTKRAKMNIDRKMPTFKVNWEKVRAESGLVPPIRFNLDIGRQAYQRAWDAVGIISENGTRAMNMQNGNVLSQIAYERSQARRVEVNLGRMPQSLPEVEWDMGHFSISWESNELSVEWDLSELRPKITVDPYSVQIKLSQYPNITIKFEPEIRDYHARKKVDRKI